MQQPNTPPEPVINTVEPVDFSHNNHLKANWLILAIGSLAGLLLTLGLLSGDSQGRVNILYLLLIYFFIPLLSMVVGCLSLFSSKGLNLSWLVTKFSLGNTALINLTNRLRQQKLDKIWLFYQSQLAALGFSIASLAIFFMMLLITDVNFVWRSTLLSAEQVNTFLESIALPWQFWASAQPSEWLLTQTFDSRLLSNTLSQNTGSWWRFVLAMQIVYCVLPRLILALISYWFFKKRNQTDFIHELNNTQNKQKAESAIIDVKSCVNDLPHWVAINNWANINLALLESVALDLKKQNVINGGPLASESDRAFAIRWQGEQVVLVKAWEPPMAELADFMQNGKGFVWPLDWQADHLVKLSKVHFLEWLRFVNKQNDWQLFVPKELMYEPTK